MIRFPEIKPVIHIVGAGGTGGFTFTNLARLLAGSNVPIHIYDGDIVEVKNLKRQQFALGDVTLNKTMALTNWANINLLEPSPIHYYDEYLTDSDEFLANIYLATEDGKTPIIISTVDNVATRKLINSALENLDIPYIAIDSGNNNQAGQVVITTTHPTLSLETPFSKPELVRLANMFAVYPELNDIEDKNPGLDPSCDEVVESEPQAMMANSRNGDIIANIVMSLLSNKPLQGNVYESNLEDFTTKVRLVTL